MEEELLKFADFMDQLAEMDPDYGLEMFFKIPEEVKQKSKVMIERIEEIDKTMPTVDRPTKGKLSFEKGLLLEKLALKILNIRNMFSVSERVICDSNEIDILFQPATNNAMYISLLPEFFKKDYLIECKNHKKKIDVTLLGKFYSLIRYKKAGFGIMVSNKPLTGESTWKDSIGLIKKIYLRDNTLIINLTIDMIREVVYSNANIIKIINREVSEIIYHTKFEEDILIHPAEKLMRLEG